MAEWQLSEQQWEDVKRLGAETCKFIRELLGGRWEVGGSDAQKMGGRCLLRVWLMPMPDPAPPPAPPKRYCVECKWEWAHPIAPDMHFCLCPKVSFWYFRRDNAGPVPCDCPWNRNNDCAHWEAKG